MEGRDRDRRGSAVGGRRERGPRDLLARRAAGAAGRQPGTAGG
ncbi:hypothetical protein [Streptomyces sp. NPDC000877]